MAFESVYYRNESFTNFSLKVASRVVFSSSYSFLRLWFEPFFLERISNMRCFLSSECDGIQRKTRPINRFKYSGKSLRKDTKSLEKYCPKCMRKTANVWKTLRKCEVKAITLYEQIKPFLKTCRLQAFCHNQNQCFSTDGSRPVNGSWKILNGLWKFFRKIKK